MSCLSSSNGGKIIGLGRVAYTKVHLWASLVMMPDVSGRCGLVCIDGCGPSGGAPNYTIYIEPVWLEIAGLGQTLPAFGCPYMDSYFGY